MLMTFSHDIRFATIVSISRHVEIDETAYNYTIYLKKTCDQMLCYSWSRQIEDIRRIKLKLIPGNIEIRYDNETEELALITCFHGNIYFSS